jgi:hypothetical protein
MHAHRKAPHSVLQNCIEIGRRERSYLVLGLEFKQSQILPLEFFRNQNSFSFDRQTAFFTLLMLFAFVNWKKTTSLHHSWTFNRNHTSSPLSDRLITFIIIIFTTSTNKQFRDVNVHLLLLLPFTLCTIIITRYTCRELVSRELCFKLSD